MNQTVPDRYECRTLNEVLENSLPMPEALVFCDPYGREPARVWKVLKADQGARVKPDHYTTGLRVRLHGAVAHMTYDYKGEKWLVLLDLGGQRNPHRVYRGGLEADLDVWDAKPLADYPEYPCEKCGQDAGEGYFSAPDHNQGGVGVVLCEGCV